MDQSIYDSFRWLDEDGDLDLSLDEYHSHVANAATGKAKIPRLPSFRRSLSFSTNTMKHRASPSMPTRAFPSSHTIQPLSPLPPLSPLSPITPRSNRRSTSRPPSRRLQSSHAAKSSTSSIDPSAQYYHDPDARLKLRVYLASPQKFDEAIEFGFPSLDQIHNQQNKENISPEPTSPRPSRTCAGTFFEDDDGNVVGSPGDSIEEPSLPTSTSAPGSGHGGYAPTSTSAAGSTSASAPAAVAPPQPQMQSFPRLSMRDTPRPSVDTHTNTPSLLQRRQSILPKSTSKTPHRLPGNREMTLKMTLTRPDLREESPTPSATPDDPLRLAALPPADRTQQIWDDLDEEQGVVRKMWRKLRRRV
ncbi:hypothetical protein N7509_014093 [Penicillium cosmopolitanum]|uniref:Uncharacterized protein n=1 Tax=Penicillium cosmopolitanum TaxID=1131564 RepID=A0A9W9RZZ2_9EURO|nr:uncharacterized protein N7509_014093 [Penicillium cosmopolitanum]KAJ5369481.1 hypothetical protein N7509_014093 [Penicillium cosmopolitanum]